MTLTEKFAKNLKQTRLQRKLSQEALAKEAKISVSYVSMLERGQREPPLATIETLAAALHKRPLDLLT